MEAKLTSKGQVTVPKNVREALSLKTGDKLEFVVMDNGAVKVIARNKPASRLKGIVPKPEKAATLEEIKEAIIQGALRL